MSSKPLGCSQAAQTLAVASRSRVRSDFFAMLTTAKILSDLIKLYTATVVNDSGEYRLIVPGLTLTIAEQLHEDLLNSGINSSLAINSSRKPNEALRWLLPASLTSLDR